MSQEAISKLQEQQSRVEPRSPQWMVAQQLMDICRAEPESAELIARDLDNKAMTIVEAEKKLKAFADQHKKNGFACVTSAESDLILREFYGLPPRPGEQAGGGASAGALGLDLSDFWG